MQKHNIEVLQKVFCTGLGIQSEQFTDDLSYEDNPVWDSVAHMRLISSLEEAFDILLDTNDIIDISSVAAAKEILKKYEIEFE